MFELLPIEEAMAGLVVREVPGGAAHEWVGSFVGDIAPELQSGLWLYVDDLDRSHRVSQKIDTPTGSFWHGIMHRREGDFSNSHYWFRKTGQHPAMDDVSGYDPHAFVDAVEGDGAQSSPELVALQRQEWATLFEWCARGDV